MFQHEGVTIRWLGHDGFLLEGDGVRVCIDPFKTTVAEPVDYVLITHEHFDHLSVEDIKRFLKPETVIVCCSSCVAALDWARHVTPLRQGDTIGIGRAKLHAVPAYNINKFRDPATKTVFHPKADGKLGYLITLAGTTIYHAGDTDHIPEMREYRCDIALLPVSGTYVMTAQEAVEAARTIRPNIAIPMHYGGIVGTVDDARAFKEQLRDSEIRVEILERE